MKRRYYILLLVMSLVIGALIVVQGAISTPKNFCLGTKSKLSRINFSGQGRSASLVDPGSLEYLAAQPKLKALPTDMQISDGPSFDATIGISCCGIGTMQALVSSDKKVVRFGYFDSLLSDASFVYVLIGSNAPHPLGECLTFLVDGNATGKEGKRTRF